jgi:hypothetical protein
MRKGKNPNLNLDPYLYKMDRADPDLALDPDPQHWFSKFWLSFVKKIQKEDRYESEGKPEQTFDAAFGTICRINECFEEASINFINIFLFKKAN